MKEIEGREARGTRQVVALRLRFVFVLCLGKAGEHKTASNRIDVAESFDLQLAGHEGI